MRKDWKRWREGQGKEEVGKKQEKGKIEEKKKRKNFRDRRRKKSIKARKENIKLWILKEKGKRKGRIEERKIGKIQWFIE